METKKVRALLAKAEATAFDAEAEAFTAKAQERGWTQERVPVDGFTIASDEATASVLHNDRFELTLFRRPLPRPRPPIGLTATWDGHNEAVVLAEVPRTVRRVNVTCRCAAIGRG
jgi:hypothetical protein